jgi:hypothetical protein
MAIAVCCALASTEAATAPAALAFAEELFSRSYAPEVAAAAVDAWGLLATVVSDRIITEAGPRDVAGGVAPCTPPHPPPRLASTYLLWPHCP